MKLERNQIVKPFSTIEVERPWGYYGLYADNVKSTTKILYIKKGEMLSLQYHFRRSQFYLLLSENFKIEYSSKQIPKNIIDDEDEDRKTKNFKTFLEENLVTVEGRKFEMFGFLKRIVHRATYNGDDEYGLILDAAFGENIESDIFRIEDKYGREDIII